MGSTAETILSAVRESGKLTAGDLMALRRAYYADGAISPEEAEMLIRIDAAMTQPNRDWPGVLAVALTDFLVHQERPKGYVSEENAAWLIAAIRDARPVANATEIHVVTKIVEAADYCPESLTRFAMERLKHAILCGAPGYDDDAAEPASAQAGVVTEAHAEAIQRLLFAASGCGHVAISRAEGEMLFDINEATDQSRNHPAWSDLFVKAIINHVLSGSGYRPPSREDALKREAWLEERGSTADFLYRMLSGGFAGVFAAYQEQSAEERAIARLEAEKRRIVLAEEVTADESGWVAERIARDGVIHENEKAILKALTGKTCPSINPWLDAMIKAA